MKKIKNDPLLTIFKNSSEGEYNELINSIQNIQNFFTFISSEKNTEDSKIDVLENLLIILKKNRYIAEYFSSYKNKSIYLYVFDLYLSKNSSEKIKSTILKFIEELIFCLETNKEIYEYLFQNLSKIYNKECLTQEKTPENLYNHLTLLNCLLDYKEKIPKPFNYYSLSGKGKLALDLNKKKIKIGYCMTFILNFKIADAKETEEISNLLNITFSNNTNIKFKLKYPNYLYIQEGKEKEGKIIRGLPINELVILVINLIVEENNLSVFNFLNGDNNLVPIKFKNNLDIQKDTIESLEFFENFYGEVTSITMLLQKEKSTPTINTKEFLPIFKKFAQGFHKKKELEKFLHICNDNIAYEGQTLSDKISAENKLTQNLIFIFTPFNYFHSSWEKIKNQEENKIIDDYFGKYNLKIIDKENSIRNHKYNNYQKKIDLVCNITNFLPIAEIFLVYPQLLTEQNLILYLQIMKNIINYRTRNVTDAKKHPLPKILCLFLEKYPNQIFTEKILDAFINIGKDMFKNNIDIDLLTKTYFKHFLLNEKILSKYSQNLQIKFWNQLLLFCESDSDKLENFLKMNRICLILRFYDKNKNNEMCCKKHLDMFKKEFCENCNIMEPSMDKKLKDIWKIIDLIINSQKPEWVLSLFKLLMLDLSPCLTNFIITAVIKALIRHDEKDNKNDFLEDDKILKSMVFIKKENSWLKDFINEMISNKYETIIINSFMHSLPDIRFDMLKLIYQIYQALCSLDKKDEFKVFFDMMKKYLLPQKMFYEKINDKETLVINDNALKKYLNKAIMLLIHWLLDEQLIEADNNITLNTNLKFDKNVKIKNTELFEIIYNLINQTNYDIELMTKFLEILTDLIKNPENCDILLNNYKIFLLLIDIVYESYKLKINNIEKNKNIEICYSLGKSIIPKIFINDLIFKEKKYINDNLSFNEISLLFLWGDKIIFKYNDLKNGKVKENVFSFIREIFSDILTQFKLIIFPKMNSKTNNDIRQNFIKSNYQQNYLIFMSKLFEFSFEYSLDQIIKDNKLKTILSTNDVMAYNSAFLTSMSIEKTKKNSISFYWKDYIFFEEIYSKINYIWQKDNIYKRFQKEKIKNSNKLEKYENIIENIILDKNQKNKFKKELEFLCSNYSKGKEYELFDENKDTNDFVEILSNNKILNMTLMKQIQITLVSMLTIILSKENKIEFEKWLKELKHFSIFIIIASSNIIILEKEDKDSAEKKFSSYMKLQDECLYTLYNCLYFLYQIREISTLCKEKVDKICVSVFTLCFAILKYTYNYRKKNKISKKFNVGYKYKIDDLSGSAVFVLFNDFIKDKTKEKEKGDNILLNLDKLNILLDKKAYSQNIMKLFSATNWSNSFYKNNSINGVLHDKYFPIMEYKIIAEQRVNALKKIEENAKYEEAKWEYSADKLLQLLPSYEKELVHYSNNSLEKNLKKKNLYKVIKKDIFSWNGYWSNRTLFYQENFNKKENDSNDSIADKNNVSKIKYKLINHYTKSFMKPLLVPILDINYYLPDFSGFDSTTIFNTKEKFLAYMDIDKIKKIKDDKIKEDEKKSIKENYLRKIYMKSNPDLADKLLKISDSLDFGKEEEFSVFKEEKDTKNNSEENKNNEEEKKYYLSCLVKTSHHIKGVCFIDNESLNFKVFLNQKTGNAMSGVNVGFTDKDDDYDEERKTCFGSYFMFHQKDKNLYKISINYKDIKLILLKRYYYKNSALEIFTFTNKSYYFNFKYEEDRDKFINNIIQKLKEPKAIVNDLKEGKDIFNVIGYSIDSKEFKDKRKYTKKEQKEIEKNEKKNKKLSKKIKDWSKWKINNFQFLMWINFFSNRSYNDISQYPIFPWILSNYNDPLNIEPEYFESSFNDINNINNNINTSLNQSQTSVSSLKEIPTEDLDKKKKKKMEEKYSYRDLKLPMGMLEINEESKKRKKDFIELFNTIKHDKDEFEGTKPYFYGTNYSNPVYVCNFLMRLFPFTHISIELQGCKLDDPNRLFLSVSKSFNNSISQKTDVRELIPEFFYLPEMFLNINDINLGKQEDNSIVYNVLTPCKNNAYSFIEIMKRIFENDKISFHLNNWVDLIFGYKSKGKEAENAKNIFTEASYQETVNLTKIEDKTSYLRLVEFGLIPSQIMNKECPKREKKRDIRKEKELTENNWNTISKIKIVQIKHDNSKDKNMKKENGEKSKLLKAEIINKDKIIMFFDNSTIIENKINNTNEDITCVYKINGFENKINENYYENISNKIIKFCNFGTIVVVGGYYDGRLEIIYLENKIEKRREVLYPFIEEGPILSVCIGNDEKFMIVGNSTGSIAIYKIDIGNDVWTCFKTNFHQMSSISDININNELNLFATAGINGYINLYTLPLCKLVRSIKTPLDIENNGKCNYVLLSESSLPSIIIINEDKNNSHILSYSINGKLLNSFKEDKTMGFPLKVKDLNTLEYLVYYSNSQINIRNLPSLTLQIVIKSIVNVKSLCVNSDLTAIYAINEDGTQIQAIKN